MRAFILIRTRGQDDSHKVIDPQTPTWVVSWSLRCVYLVRLILPKFLTCMTLGSTDLSKWSSRVGAVTSRLYSSSSFGAGV